MMEKEKESSEYGKTIHIHFEVKLSLSILL